ncbi:hypothetical protein FOA52_000029 [Chlamydomonas sp. UWO 241]|nr:hypothetical protein FOA52_000029 [Chlamydomonas sp. UWO 241]
MVGSSSVSNCLAKEGEEETVRDAVSKLDMRCERVVEDMRHGEDVIERGVVSKLDVCGERAVKMKRQGEEGGLGGVARGLAVRGARIMGEEDGAEGARIVVL